MLPWGTRRPGCLALSTSQSSDLAYLLRYEAHASPQILRRASVDVNGAGLLLTTEECLLSPVQARNPALSRAEIETALADYLGIDRVLWLRNGIRSEETH